MEEQTLQESNGLADEPRRVGRPIVRQNLHDATVSRLRDMIIEGDLVSGTRIPESELGRDLGVSRTPLREALKVLASEGLIELFPGRGAIVKQFSPKEIRDSLFVIGNLEAIAGRLACANATDEQIKDVRKLHDQMIAAFKKRTRLNYFKLNQAIHTAIVKISGNDALVSVHTTIQARVRRVRYRGHEGPEKWAGAVSDHEAIIASLEARSGENLAGDLMRHMENAWERLKDTSA